jgi:nucleoside-diphosphate-sugar epimerase
MSQSTSARLPKGGTILVTGVTGYIGSWVAYEALSLGYKVRGAVRSLEKAAWLQEHFDAKFGQGQYSQVVLADLSDKAGVEAAIKDVAGIVHIAVNTQLSPSPEPYIPQNIEETLIVLKAAQAESSVKSVVLTSSSMAAVAWGATGKIPKDAYNEEFIKLAWDSSLEHPAKMYFVYAAAKAQAEMAAWKYVQEEKPQYTLNTILPNCNFGPSLVPEKQGHPSTGGWAKDLYDGDLSTISSVPSQYFIDVRDTAKLHIAALVDNGTSNERLFGFAEPYNWNSLLAVFRKLWPQKEFINDLPGLGWDESIPPTESALKALKDVFGQDEWTSLETALKDAGYPNWDVGRGLGRG